MNYISYLSLGVFIASMESSLIILLVQLSSDESGSMNPNSHQLNKGILEQTNYGEK